MTGDDFKNPFSVSRRSRRDRIVDWLGAQGPSLLTIYMCGAVAMVAWLAYTMG